MIGRGKGLFAAVFLAVGLGVGGAAGAEELVVEDFEEYASGMIVGHDWQSKPWARFGPATMDNVATTSSTGRVLGGSLSGMYSAAWPARYGAVRRVFDVPQDLSRFTTGRVKVRSTNPATKTRVKIAFSNGTTTYATAVTGKVTDQGQEFVLSLKPMDMVLTDGGEPLMEVVRNVQMIGLDFISGMESYSEILIFDDLILSDVPLESPTSEAGQSPESPQSADAQSAGQ